MKMNIKKACLYAACLILTGFYFCVLWWGENPDVGMEYRMYYITHELKDWPGYGNLSYQPGTLLSTVSLRDRNGELRAFDVCQTKGAGWMEEQYDGSTCKGGEAYIYLRPDITKSQAVLKLNVSAASGLVDVYVDDSKVGSINKAGEYAFSFGGYEEGKLITIKFEAVDSSFTLQTVEID